VEKHFHEIPPEDDPRRGCGVNKSKYVCYAQLV